MRTKPPQKRSDSGAAEKGAGIERRFLEELAETLDLEKTIDRLGLSRDGARRILAGLLRLCPAPPPERGERALEGTFSVYADGASRGNPGLAGAGAVILGPDGRVIKRLRSFLGTATNNVAEYRAMLMALKAARAIGARSVRVYADSELVVRQVRGEYRVKSPDLIPLYEELMELVGGFRDFRVSHIPREKNRDADVLANEAIDTRLK